MLMKLKPFAESDDGGGEEMGSRNEILVLPPVETRENKKPCLRRSIEQGLIRKREDAD